MNILNTYKRNRDRKLIQFLDIQFLNIHNKENFKKKLLYYNISEIIFMLIQIKFS
jgi:hypothetical protein